MKGQMQETIKVAAVRALGGEVILHGDAYDQAAARADELARERGLSFVHPYDDPDVIAGQGTIGIELLRQLPGAIDAIFVPVGGGGLIAGIGAAVKALRPEVKIVCVEPEEADGMTRSLAAVRRVTLDRVGRFADGVAVRTPGEETFRVAQRVVDDCVVVTNDEICAAIKDLFEDRRAVLEPSGALAFAGLKKWVEQRPGERGRTLVAIASGANMNFDRLRHVSERAEIGERREAVLAVTIPEKPGSFRRFCKIVGARAVTEFNYRFADPLRAHVFVGVKVESRGEAESVIGDLRAEGYEVLDLTDDEIAKLHVRHMVGGRAPGAVYERRYAFLFPERAGALPDFLEAMRHPWNISLFHYRNHGSDHGRVLVGLQVPPGDEDELAAFLDRVGFEWSCVDDDPACKMFLG